MNMDGALKAVGGSGVIFASEGYLKVLNPCGVVAFYGIKIQNFVAKIFTFKVAAPLTFVWENEGSKSAKIQL